MLRHACSTSSRQPQSALLSRAQADTLRLRSLGITVLSRYASSRSSRKSTSRSPNWVTFKSKPLVIPGFDDFNPERGGDKCMPYADRKISYELWRILLGSSEPLIRPYHSPGDASLQFYHHSPIRKTGQKFSLTNSNSRSTNRALEKQDETPRSSNGDVESFGNSSDVGEFRDKLLRRLSKATGYEVSAVNNLTSERPVLPDESFPDELEPSAYDADDASVKALDDHLFQHVWDKWGSVHESSIDESATSEFLGHYTYSSKSPSSAQDASESRGEKVLPQSDDRLVPSQSPPAWVSHTWGSKSAINHSRRSQNQPQVSTESQNQNHSDSHDGAKRVAKASGSRTAKSSTQSSPRITWDFSPRQKRPSWGSIRKHHISATIRNSFQNSTRSFSSSSTTPAALSDEVPDKVASQRPPIIQPIRKRLADWEETNGQTMDELLFLDGAVKKGQTHNELVRPSNITESTVNEDEDFEDQSLLLAEQDELFDPGESRRFLRRGDLVELSMTGGREGELAIFVRTVNRQSQFFTISGRYTQTVTQNVQFYIKGFVDPEELDPLLPFLPSTEVPKKDRSRLLYLLHAPPRTLSAPLVDKMQDFANKSSAAYRAATSSLDKAYDALADKREYRYVTLEEIADKVLPETMQSKDADGRYRAPVLHAIFRSLSQHQLGFRSQPHLSYAGLFEVSPLVEVQSIMYVVDRIREYQEYKVLSAREKVTPSISVSKFLDFLQKCRTLIDRSRTRRPVTPFDTIGPADPNLGLPEHSVAFEGNDYIFLRFMESWAALSTFSLNSETNSIPAMLLRATERYNDRELTRGVGWMFLQEIGVIPPWQTRAGFDLRLPGTGLRLHQKQKTSRIVLPPDSMSDLRTEWKDLPVYCIDNEDALEIDDGISIESAGTDQYWIHVHVADPGSQIMPHSDLSKSIVANAVETVYTPDHVFFMLPPAIANSHFSLKPDNPALTFSIKVNSNGEILGQEVKPYVLRKVTYLTYETMNQIVEDAAEDSASSTSLSIGGARPKDPNRKLSRPEDLSQEQKEQLRLLHRIGKQYSRQKRKNGAIEAFPSRPEVSLTMNESSTRKNASSTMDFGFDPSIELRAAPFDLYVSTDRDNAVASCMKLACEAAARWCDERGIPVAYRVTQPDPDGPDLADHYRNTILPAIRPDGKISIDVAMSYVRALGAAIPSTTAAPHIAIGASRYTRCTSPLRRYNDLLVHWQIEAALREEAKLGRSLIGSTREDYLPFTRSNLDKLLPVLYSKEIAIKKAKLSATKSWIVRYLIRAWHFKEADFPDTFKFMVLSVSDDLVRGVIVHLGIEATFSLKLSEPPEAIARGDIYEAKLSEMSAYTGTITVEPIRALQNAEGTFNVDAH